MDLALLINRYTETHRHLRWPRQRLLHECLRSAIRDGTLAAGTRLAASRALAEELQVARNTVLYAYEQLASEGFVNSDRRGTVVAALSPMASSAAATAPARRLAAAPSGRHGQAVQAGESGAREQPAGQQLALRARALRPVFGPAGRAGAFVPGLPALEQFPLALWRRLLDRAWRSLAPAQLNYGDPAGEALLRAAIADHLRASRGVVCDASRVFITEGSQSSLDLCMRVLADHGETVWLENPGYGGALAAARAAGLAIAGIEVDEEGLAPQPDDWLLRPPRLVYTTPSHQYPTGSVMSLRRRMALIASAREAGALIIEDDYDSEFRHDGAPLSAMQGLSPDAPVLYLGTFSKTMFPGLRIGFVVTPAALTPAFAAMRAQSHAGGRSAEQLALAAFLTNGHFARHVRRMRRLYRERRDALVAALARHMAATVTVHGGSAGMHLSLRLRDPCLDDAAICALAREQGIEVNALSRHAVQGASAWRGLMLGYAQVPAVQMDELVARLAAVVWQAAAAQP